GRRSQHRMAAALRGDGRERICQDGRRSLRRRPRIGTLAVAAAAAPARDEPAARLRRRRRAQRQREARRIRGGRGLNRHRLRSPGSAPVAMRLLPGLVHHPDGLARCWWATGDPLYVAYHDQEWGRPVTDDRRLFEKICLEGFQAGLSWLTILRKRPNFRAAFADFDIDRVARFGARDVARLLKDAGIVRHRGKIESTINNAKQAAALQQECGSLAAYFWRWEPDPRSRPRRLTRNALTQLA